MANRLVALAASRMSMRAEEDLMVAEMRIEKYGHDDATANKLLEDNRRILEAIELMDEFEGCW